ncbi:fimbrial protein [Cronobacter turicensis]|uniref:fimbrial protein n=1 Tax=Cronobacter turicensis TaxID=413502 RepID=UPI001D725DEF|nr:fimbrial protein [Cronobacter turicensis]EGT4490797.1 hypothetical protein [Cronobacter turicensis]EKM0436569.1 fimbrial protein [Cronobacter turicensis]ELY4320207.1 fimbrial protein [Cronobacter turicensis]ELY5943912.1 fimbrial protein [Cronobacter turicensis]ELY5965036.1 fimbrial protein [Cronobacter turicensis]
MNIFNNQPCRQICLLSALLLACSFYAKQGHATCSVIAHSTDYLDLGSVTVQRDIPVGTVIAQRQFSGQNKQVGSCDSNGGMVYGYYYYGNPQSTSIPHVYTSTIPGVGISMSEGESRFYGPTPWSSYFSNVGLWDLSAGPIVKLYKIGDITPGTFTYGMAGQYAIGNQPVINYYFTGGSVSQAACSITTTNLTFPIGNVLASAFGSTVGTIPTGAQNTQNLGLNCDANANINVTLSGTQNADVSDTSVLALTGQGSSDVASGVGVQLLYNNSPLKLNNRIVLKKSSGGQETFPLVARYYQTKSTVTTGKANASATLDLTYQ